MGSPQVSFEIMVGGSNIMSASSSFSRSVTMWIGRRNRCDMAKRSSPHVPQRPIAARLRSDSDVSGMPQHLKLIYGKAVPKRLEKSQDNLRKINFKKAKFTVNPARGNQYAGWTPKSLLEFRRWCHTACLMDILQRLAEETPAGLHCKGKIHRIAGAAQKKINYTE